MAQVNRSSGQGLVRKRMAKGYTMFAVGRRIQAAHPSTKHVSSRYPASISTQTHDKLPLCRPIRAVAALSDLGAPDPRSRSTRHPPWTATAAPRLDNQAL